MPSSKVHSQAFRIRSAASAWPMCASIITAAFREPEGLAIPFPAPYFHRMIGRAVLVFMLMMASAPAWAERIEFEMYVFGVRFGTMEVTRTWENDSTELFTLHAKGKTDFLWMQRQEESKYRVRYRNGVLVSSQFEYLDRGERDRWSKVRKTANGYEVVRGDADTKVIPYPIELSMVRIYFETPANATTVFCEEHGHKAQIHKPEEDAVYSVVCEAGERSTYHWNEDELRRIEIHLPLVTVTLKRRD